MRVMVVVLWIWLEEMMHQVRTRHCQEGEECQDSTERTATPSSLAHRSPPLPTTCSEGTHSATALTDHALVSLKMALLLTVNLSALLAGQQDARWYRSSALQNIVHYPSMPDYTLMDVCIRRRDPRFCLGEPLAYPARSGHPDKRAEPHVALLLSA
jgi:hypothetical protein